MALPPGGPAALLPFVVPVRICLALPFAARASLGPACLNVGVIALPRPGSLSLPSLNGGPFLGRLASHVVTVRGSGRLEVLLAPLLPVCGDPLCVLGSIPLRVLGVLFPVLLPIFASVGRDLLLVLLLVATLRCGTPPLCLVVVAHPISHLLFHVVY